MSDLSAAERAREAARRCETAGLLVEADLLYRLAVNLELDERAASSASLARVLIAAGLHEQARPFVINGNDPVLHAVLALESHDLSQARQLLDDARERDPFDPRSASARGRLFFLERKFPEAVSDLLEAALLRPEGLPDSVDSRFLKAARALASGEIPGWKEAVAAAQQRLEAEAARRSSGVPWPDRAAALVRALVSRTAESSGLLERAKRLEEMGPLSGMGDHALLAASGGGDLRRIGAGSFLYRAGDKASEIYFVVSGTLDLARETPVGSQALGDAAAGEFVGEEALVGLPRTADARARDAATVLGLSPEFLFENPDRAPWLRHLRACLARRLASLNDYFQAFFPKEESTASKPRGVEGRAVVLTPEEKSRSLTSGGLSESDRYLFAAFAEERSYPAESLLFREGDTGDALFVIASGRVRISRRIGGGEEALAILGPGEIFGEMAILNPSAAGRSADARAHEDLVLLALTRARFEGLEKSDPDGCADLSALLCRLASRRAVETAERLAQWRMMAGPG